MQLQFLDDLFDTVINVENAYSRDVRRISRSSGCEEKNCLEVVTEGRTSYLIKKFYDMYIIQSTVKYPDYLRSEILRK